MSSSRSRAWRAGVEIAADFPLAELDRWLAEPGVLVWFDLLAPEEAVLDALAAELNLDPHAVEDALLPRERPKATRQRVPHVRDLQFDPARQESRTAGFGWSSAGSPRSSCRTR